MVLTEGSSDRAAFNGFFTDLYSIIDPDIEVFFPLLSEESLNKNGEVEINYNGDITSRHGINEKNILPMLLKLFIHPELKKHPAYEYPASVVEVIHLVDIDGAYLNDNHILTAEEDEARRLPFYDTETSCIIAKNRNVIIDRNLRKRRNLDTLVNTKRLRITMAEGENESKDKPYRVFYFSSNLDHVLFDKANNESFNKVRDAKAFANQFYNDPVDMARELLNHEAASKALNYKDSWDLVMKEHDEIMRKTNIDVLVRDLLTRAKIEL